MLVEESRHTSQTISTPRLRLEPFNESFLTEQYVGWLNDPQVTAYSNQRFHKHTLQSCRAYYESFAGTPNLFWAIIRRNDGCHVGNLCATIEPEHGVADLSILIGERSCWGQGIGAEAWQAAIHFLFDQRSLRKVTGGTLAINEGMIRVMKKCGMQEEGRRRRHYLIDGKEVDIVYFGRFANDMPDGVKSREVTQTL